MGAVAPCARLFQEAADPLLGRNGVARRSDAEPGERYLVYLKSGNADFDLPKGDYVYGWFNPRTGEGADKLLASGRITGPCKAMFTKPGEKDWLLSVTELSKAHAANLGAALELSALQDFHEIEVDGFVAAYRDDGHDALAINPSQHKDKFAAARTEFNGPAGAYRVTLATIAESDGESTYRLVVNGKRVGSFTNPKPLSSSELLSGGEGEAALALEKLSQPPIRGTALPSKDAGGDELTAFAASAPPF